MIRVPRLMLTTALVASSSLSLSADADADRAKAAECLACLFSDDFVGEAKADILSLIEAVRAPDSERPGDSKGLTEADLRTSRLSLPEESDAHRKLYGLSAPREKHHPVVGRYSFCIPARISL